MDLALLRDRPFRRLTLDYVDAGRRARFARFIQRGTTWAARWLCARLGFEHAQSLGPAGALLRFARGFPADLTIAHTEIPIWAAQHLIRDGRKVAVDIEDWYSEDLLVADRRSRPLRLLRHAESFVLNRAVYASATAESMAAALAAAYHCPRPIVLHNSFPLQPQARPDRPAPEGPPRFIWFSQTIGPGRGLELFLSAWALTRNPSEIHLLGDERPGYRDQIVSRLPAERRPKVRLIPLVTPQELPAKLAEFDLGLALEPRWPRNRDITITNKILQYMNAGLALITTDTAGQTEVMRAAPDSGLLVTAHETRQLARQLDALLGDPSRLRAMQQASRTAAVREFCWERQEPALLAAVARALAPG
jgi:glycosyltransferase involved in cell wall biosynthesis